MTKALFPAFNDVCEKLFHLILLQSPSCCGHYQRNNGASVAPVGRNGNAEDHAILWHFNGEGEGLKRHFTGLWILQNSGESDGFPLEHMNRIADDEFLGDVIDGNVASDDPATIDDDYMPIAGGKLIDVGAHGNVGDAVDFDGGKICGCHNEFV